MTSQFLSPEEITKRYLDLYKIYSEDLRKFDTINWQFPLALLSVNAVAVNWLKSDLLLLLGISVINFLLLAGFVKHAHIRRGLVAAIKNLEEKLREIFGADIIADFSHVHRVRWMRIPTQLLVAYVLLFLDVFAFAWLAWRILA